VSWAPSTGSPPPPHVTVVSDVTDATAPLTGRLAVPGNDDGVLLPPATMSRLLCDADITRVLTTTSAATGPDTTDSEATSREQGYLAAVVTTLTAMARSVLYVGRSRRTVPARLRRALEVRDEHCAFPGCRARVARCHAHHVTPWEHGGATECPTWPCSASLTTTPSTKAGGPCDCATARPATSRTAGTSNHHPYDDDHSGPDHQGTPTPPTPTHPATPPIRPARARRNGHPDSVSSVVIEPMSLDDEVVEALLRLLPQVSSRGSDVTAERVRRVVQQPSTTVIVAKVDGRVVGSATLIRLLSLVGQFGYVEEAVVDESARGAGIGRSLIEGLADIARAEGLDFLELTSRPAREAANRLYQSLGFALRETNVYRLDLTP